MSAVAASRQQLEDALIAAHEAGDFEGAQVLADEIKSTQVPTSRASDPSLYSKTDALKNAALSYGKEGLRAIGSTGRNIAQGVLGLPSLAADSPELLYNAGAKLLGAKSRAPTPFLDSLANLNAPELAPRNAVERVSNDVQRSLAGAATGMGVGGALSGSASPVVSGVGTALASNPVMQGVSAATGATASGVAREQGVGPTGQMLAGLAGGLAPPLLGAGAPALVRGAFRGNDPSAMQDTIGAFGQAGTTASVGQATQNRGAQALESYLAKSPGGSGPMAAKATKQATEISQGLDKIAAAVAGKRSPEQAGRAITQGISGEGGFIDQFKAKQAQLYDRLDEHIPLDSRVDVSNTRSTLANLNAKIKGAENVSKLFQNSKIAGIEGALQKDLMAAPIEGDFEQTVLDMVKRADPSKYQEMLVGFRDGKLPFEAVKKLRTLVGNELSDSWVGSDVPRSKWKALYGALSSDIESAATQAGPKALQTWKRANSYTRAGMDRIDSFAHVIDKNGGPEKVFSAALSGTKDGATTLRSVMQSLPEDAQKQLSATVLRKLGMAKSGAQNDIGDVFSTETFLTRWGDLSDEAKRTLFDRFDPKFSNSVDKVAKVASNLREGSKVFRNPSGTGQAAALGTTLGGAGMALLTGHPGYAAALGGFAGVNNLAARGMTNPNFVRWLAQSTAAPNTAPIMLNQGLLQQ